MDKKEKLAILKMDLQMFTSANDLYLEKLLEFAEKSIRREGNTLIKNDIECDMMAIEYAAWLFRKRAAEQNGMPRSLRWQLNNMLFGKKKRRRGP